ncbi:bifunctional diaminohydroxyphosphoribosylaminopyrimidine deaminase/5-amino-6-(5-phosphoribosylamino)uracil reductase RibD [Granulicoccus phenolivorans]|uniref:bifunctional diaminohydroxyphosphoribosylaminopyrimidine deaminase/5-amino-6-(5-phosphoribosylamino)uracil reductase RibD n=1 Tax=Granulicoccus phenolivorans TaxID=266854 RepID=UPI003570D015
MPARDRDLLQRALTLAALGPLADPNPRVGAVITDPTGAIVGEGFHHGAGTPHAEVEALRAAGAAAAGGTAYVSLEPCNHTGRTGPCAQALLAAGIVRVVHAASDPNPSARGGAATLRAAGVEVASGETVAPDLAAAAEALNEAWGFAVTRHRPQVIWKYAATLDGRSAAADGTSQWITGPAARADVHDLRATAGAILVGTGTVLADDPQLTVRWPDGTLRDRQPLRVVVGRTEIPADARVRDTAAETLQLSGSPADVLAELQRRDIRRVWLEGGPRLAAAFWRAGLVDRTYAYLAPALLGAGATAIGDLGITTITGITRLQFGDVRRIGADLRLTLEPTPSAPAQPGSTTHPIGSAQEEAHVHRNR